MNSEDRLPFWLLRAAYLESLTSPEWTSSNEGSKKSAAFQWETLVADMEFTLKELDSSSKKIASVRSSLEQEYEASATEINTLFGDLVKAVESRRNELIQNLVERKQNADKELAEAYETSQRTRESLNSGVIRVRQALEDSDESSAQYFAVEMLKSFSDLSEPCINTPYYSQTNRGLNSSSSGSIAADAKAFTSPIMRQAIGQVEFLSQFLTSSSSSTSSSSAVVADVSNAPSDSLTRILPVVGAAFCYKYDGDQNGILYWMGCHYGTSSRYTNPARLGNVVVTASSCQFGSPDFAVGRPMPAHGKHVAAIGHILTTNVPTLPCETFVSQNENNCWLQLHFGMRYSVRPTAYTLRNCLVNAYHSLANWEFQGSVDGRDWVTLSRHEGDFSLKHEKGSVCTWRIEDCHTFFNRLRIYVTGPNQHTTLVPPSPSVPKASPSYDSQQESYSSTRSFKNLTQSPSFGSPKWDAVSARGSREPSYYYLMLSGMEVYGYLAEPVPPL